MFSHEWTVTIELPNHERLTAFVDRRLVDVERPPKEGESVPGNLKVLVVEDRQKSLVLELPRPSIGSGSRLVTPRSFVTAPA